MGHIYTHYIYIVYTVYTIYINKKYKYKFILGSSIIRKIFMTNSVINMNRVNTSSVIHNSALYS